MAELEAEREEKRLDTQVRKPADAAAYEKQVQAEAERVARISIAEAQAREVELAAAAKAMQIEQIGTSEARIATARGLADGEATKAKGDDVTGPEAIGAADGGDRQAPRRWRRRPTR